MSSIKKVPLSSVVEINPAFPVKFDNGFSSFLPMANISEQGYIIKEEERKITEVLKGYRYFKAGDVLLAMTSEKSYFLQDRIYS